MNLRTMGTIWPLWLKSLFSLLVLSLGLYAFCADAKETLIVRHIGSYWNPMGQVLVKSEYPPQRVLHDVGIHALLMDAEIWTENDERIVIDGMLYDEQNYIPFSIKKKTIAVEDDERGKEKTEFKEYVFWTYYVTPKITVSEAEFLTAVSEALKSKSYDADDEWVVRMNSHKRPSILRDVSLKLTKTRLEVEANVDLYKKLTGKIKTEKPEYKLKNFGFFGSPDSFFAIVSKVLMDRAPLYAFVRNHYLIPSILIVLAIVLDCGVPLFSIIVVVYIIVMYFITAEIHVMLVMLRFVSMQLQYYLSPARDTSVLGMQLAVLVGQLCLMTTSFMNTALPGFRMVAFMLSILLPILPTASTVAFRGVGSEKVSTTGAILKYTLLFYALLEALYTGLTIGAGTLSLSISETINSSVGFYLVGLAYYVVGQMSGLPWFLKQAEAFATLSANLMQCRDGDCPIYSFVADEVARQKTIMMYTYIVISAVVFVLMLYLVGYYLVHSRNIRANKTASVYLFAGAYQYVWVFNLAVNKEKPLDVILVVLTLFKFGALSQGIFMWVVTVIIASTVVFITGFSPDVLEINTVQKKRISEATVSRISDVLDLNQIKVVKESVVEVVYQFARNANIGNSLGKAVVIGKNMILTVRHVGDPNLDKTTPTNIMIDGKAYGHVNSMYFPKVNGSDGLMISVVDGDISKYARPLSYTYENHNSMYYPFYDKGIERVQRKIFERKSNIYKVKVNTKPGDSGLPVVNGDGRIRGVHGGYCGDDNWNYVLPFDADMVDWISSITDLNGDHSIMPDLLDALYPDRMEKEVWNKDILSKKPSAYSRIKANAEKAVWKTINRENLTVADSGASSSTGKSE